MCCGNKEGVVKVPWWQRVAISEGKVMWFGEEHHAQAIMDLPDEELDATFKEVKAVLIKQKAAQQ